MAEFTLTESEVVNDWLRRGNERGMLRERRRALLQNIDLRFPGQLPADFREMVEHQDDLALLNVWLREVTLSVDFDAVLAVLRR